MTDYGQEMEFGYFRVPDASDPCGALEAGGVADRIGYNLLAGHGHRYQPAHLDALALLGVHPRTGRRIRMFQDVGNLPLRPPAAFATAEATPGLFSGGRFEGGLSAGGFLDATQAMGALARTQGQSLERLRRRS
jgi:alkanesulfonate monooxygenase SsuD/methylene tetrahydromethanopterin reductase-like flavin-dependent oxidoreductase (luciferase family)